jgi:hypothetical protein
VGMGYVCACGWGAHVDQVGGRAGSWAGLQGQMGCTIEGEGVGDWECAPFEGLRHR